MKCDLKVECWWIVGESQNEKYNKPSGTSIGLVLEPLHLMVQSTWNNHVTPDASLFQLRG
jgi:hypothetical protein